MSTLQLSETDLEDVRKLARLFFSPREVALMLGHDQDAFAKACKRAGNAVYGAYHGARLQEEMQVRQNILELAKKGSTPAQAAAMRYVEQTNASIND